MINLLPTNIFNIFFTFKNEKDLDNNKIHHNVELKCHVLNKIITILRGIRTTSNIFYF